MPTASLILVFKYISSSLCFNCVRSCLCTLYLVSNRQHKCIHSNELNKRNVKNRHKELDVDTGLNVSNPLTLSIYTDKRKILAKL